MKTILIVDDDIHLQTLIKDELLDDGYRIATASNGKEALGLLNGNHNLRPDLIIMDLRMPRMGGLEAMGHIIKSRQCPPVIIHTAYSSYRSDVMAMAADAYVIKSHDMSELKKRVHELLND